MPRNGATPTDDRSDYYNPTPQQLRKLILSYLCHHCYVDTARAFAHESSEKGTHPTSGSPNETPSMEENGDADPSAERDDDGDEVMSPPELGELTEADAEMIMSSISELPTARAEDDETTRHLHTVLDDNDGLSETSLREVELRKQIRERLLWGQVSEAITLLNIHFPSVLNSPPLSTPASSSSFYSQSYSFPDPPSAGQNGGKAAPSPLTTPVAQPQHPTFPTSLDSTHLQLNLQVQAFVESVRTTPLFPPGLSIPPLPLATSLSSAHDPTPSAPSPTLNIVQRAQSLLNTALSLPSPQDRTLYLKEVDNVSGLMAYMTPETSSISMYLSMERREGVADQINSAILFRTRHPPHPWLEHYAKHTTFLWCFLHERGIALPPPTSWPVGLSPPGKWSVSDMTAPPFDIGQYMAPHVKGTSTG